MIKEKFCLSLFLGAIIWACSVTDSHEDLQYISVTLSTDSSNQVYTISNPLHHIASYTASDSVGYTNIAVFNRPELSPQFLSITFPGQQSGIIYWNDPVMAPQYRFRNSIMIQLGDENSFLNYRLLEGYTDVTRFGAVSERIEGKIQGIIYKYATGDTFSIHGEFSVIRLKDNLP